MQFLVQKNNKINLCLIIRKKSVFAVISSHRVYYSSFKSKKEFPHVIWLSPINGGFIQIVYETLRLCEVVVHSISLDFSGKIIRESSRFDNWA